jgi:hypothetical protein
VQEEMIPELRVPMIKQPFRARNGTKIMLRPFFKMKSDDELTLLLALICFRRLFGFVYSGLQPDYSWQMPHRSGVLCCPLVTTQKIAPHAKRPGDIDLLLIPYERDELILSRVLAIEAKVIRASFEKQSKSPNDFGNSQASALLDLGFPYTALIHFIVSDASPKAAWRKVPMGRVADGDRVIPLGSRLKDLLPADLIYRAYGRLLANAVRPEIGLAAVYIEKRTIRDPREIGFWLPCCQAAQENPHFNVGLVRSVAAYYEANSKQFLETPYSLP